MQIPNNEPQTPKKLKRNCKFTSPGFSKLHTAAIKGDVTEMAQLIEEGWNVNAVINYAGVTKGFTPLHLAADFKNTNVVRLLLEKGADFTLEDDNNRCALHLACRRQAKDIVELIVRAYLTACSRLDKNIRHAFIKRQIPIDMRIDFSDEFWPKFRPLHFAVKFRLTEILMILIECGVDVKITDSNGMTALHCFVAEYSGLIEEEMRDSRIILHRVVNNFVKDRFCPSTLDRVMGKIIHLFVSNCSDIKNSTDILGRTPMFYLYDGLRYRNCFYEELTNQGGVNWRFNSEMQGWERLYMVRRLLRWPSVDMLVTDDEGNTILHIMAQIVFPNRYANSVEEINFLIEEYLAAGGNIDQKNSAGFTPLQLNCQLYNSEVAEALLRHGADINATNTYGDTPYSILRRVREERPGRRWDMHSLTVFSYVKRLVILGAPVCELNVEICESDNLELENDAALAEARGMIAFADELYLDELDRMRKKKIDAYTSLYDVLWRDVSNLVHHASNGELFQNHFLNDYPLYGYLVKNKLKDAKARAQLIKPAKEVLKWIVPVVLPELCVNKILKNFENEDLIQLRKVAEFKACKEEEEEESIDR